MKGVWALFLVCATVSGQTSLRCRRCIGAGSLDDCVYSVPCPTGEICYMDEVLTEQLTIEYNGGCRPRDVCSRGPAVGKRSGAHMICSQCCDTKQSPECNTKICGIKGRSSTINQCYHCENGGFGGSGGSAVSDPSRCSSLMSCQSNEMCGVEAYRLSSHISYELKCISKQVCTIITPMILQQMDDCRKPNADPSMCAHVSGKRDAAGNKYCTACCGDSQCNTVGCEELLERLYTQWKAGVLDMTTLKQNGSLPATTASSG